MNKIFLNPSAYMDRWHLAQCGARWDKVMRRWYLTRKPSEAQAERLKRWLPDDLLTKESIK
jgi:hypothetical protein